MKRRLLLQAGAAASSLGALGQLAGCAATGAGGGPRVVVVGGGFAGATAARYIRMWSQHRIAVTLVEPQGSLISCPLSNLVLGGNRSMAQITLSYEGLRRVHGVQHVRDSAVRIDAERRTVQLASGAMLPYDRLVVAPGIGFQWERLPGMERQDAQDLLPHGWKAGAQTLLLQRQLQAMPDGGVFALAVPLAPYRCPPGPYERACQVAHYLSRAKPRSKVLVLDANDDVVSKPALFKKAWSQRYGGMVEYRPRHTLTGVDPSSRTLRFELQEDVRADVLNLLPPMRAGDIALEAGLTGTSRRWCEVDFLTHESRALAGVHVLGDAVLAAPGMPKSAHMANQHGKTCAAAVVALLTGEAPNPMPLYNNVCYSFVSDSEAGHVASVHRYDPALKTMALVPGSGGVSPDPSALEGGYAMAWAHNIWADTLA